MSKKRRMSASQISSTEQREKQSHAQIATEDNYKKPRLEGLRRTSEVDGLSALDKASETTHSAEVTLDCGLSSNTISYHEPATTAPSAVEDALSYLEYEGDHDFSTKSTVPDVSSYPIASINYHSDHGLLNSSDKVFRPMLGILPIPEFHTLWRRMLYHVICELSMQGEERSKFDIDRSYHESSASARKHFRPNSRDCMISGRGMAKADRYGVGSLLQDPDFGQFAAGARPLPGRRAPVPDRYDTQGVVGYLALAKCLRKS